MLVVERSASARELLQLPADPAERTVVVAHPTDGAIVLGSSQPAVEVDVTAAAAAGLSVVRRRSGGGAVLVAPGRQLWLDLFVPVDDPLFSADVIRAAIPVGEAWRRALVAAGMDNDELTVHTGRLVAAPFSRTLCFLGLGPGEVTLHGRKVIGLSQRRGRGGAWFFTMAICSLEPSREAAVLALAATERRLVEAALESGVAAVPVIPGLEARVVEEFAQA